MTKTSACDAKIAKPNEEIDRLVEEGEQLLANQIHVTYQQSDLDNATSYIDIRGCILCQALKRMGWRNISVGGSYIRDCYTNNTWSWTCGNDADPVRSCNRNPDGSCASSIIGKTLILTLDARP